jgi:predicted DNA-binding ribbon-helix-helix protein
MGVSIFMALRASEHFEGAYFASITVEHEFWDQLRLITIEYQTSMTPLITEIDRTMRLMPFQGPGRHRVRTLSSAIRVFVLQEVLARVDDLTAHANQHPASAHRSCPTGPDRAQ